MPIDLTYIQLPLSTIEAIENQIAEGYASRIRKSGIQQLSQLTSQLGVVEAGEIRLGNGVFPGSGFTGLRMAYPDSILTYNSETWNFVGVSNDVLQIGIRASDGKLIAGGGAVLIDEDGIIFDVSDDPIEWFSTSTIAWNAGSLVSDDSVFSIQGRKTVGGDVFGTLALDKDDLFADASLRLSTGEGSTTGYSTIVITKTPSILLHNRAGGIDLARDEITSVHIYNIGNIDSDFIWHGNSNDNILVFDAGNENLTIGAVAVSANYDLMLAGDGVLGLKETSTPTADTNYGKLYTKSDNNLYFQDGAGTEKTISTGVGGFINLGDASTLTISGGEITVTQSFHKVDTESGAGTDDLDTINGGSDGDILILTSVAFDRDVKLTDGVGNLQLSNSFTLGSTRDKIMLIRIGSDWHQVSESAN